MASDSVSAVPAIDRAKLNALVNESRNRLFQAQAIVNVVAEAAHSDDQPGHSHARALREASTILDEVATALDVVDLDTSREAV